MNICKKYLMELSTIVQLIIFLSIPTLLLLIYNHQHIEIALLKRKIHNLTNQKKELDSRNQALKKALGQLAQDTNSPYWQSYKELAPYEKNKIVRLTLPPLPIKNK